MYNNPAHRDGENVVTTERSDEDNEGEPVMEALRQLEKDDEGAKRIAARGFHLASEVLHPHNVHR